MPRMKLAAFADEISPNLDEQIRVCKETGVTHFELRGVEGKNVLDFDAGMRQTIKSKLADNGLAVLCIASPVGKVKITDPWEPHFERFKIAVDAAEYFSASLIRLFSYYPPEGGDILSFRDEILRRFREKVKYLGSRPITLVHENETKIYGDKGKPCLDLMKSIDSSKLRFAFDFANFVQTGEKPLDNWPLLKPYTVHIHIKDAILGSGKVVPAGQGDGQVEPILVDAHRSGYNAFLSMEPHLAAHGQFSGFTGASQFKVAVDALKAICQKNGIPLGKET
jgi:sugar phosphate isomerase/epimerase